MNIDQAMSAAIFGDKVTHDRLGRDTFVDYHFKGHELKHMKRFGEWASCSFIASDIDRDADWFVYVEPEPVRSVWGTPSTASAPPAPKPAKAAPVDAFVAAMGGGEPLPAPDDAGCTDAVAQPWAVEPKRDSWGRIIG